MTAAMNMLGGLWVFNWLFLNLKLIMGLLVEDVL